MLLTISCWDPLQYGARDGTSLQIFSCNVLHSKNEKYKYTYTRYGGELLFLNKCALALML